MGEVINIVGKGVTVDDLIDGLCEDRDTIEDITVIYTKKDTTTQVIWSDKAVSDLAMDSKLLDIMVTDFALSTVSEE